MRISRLSLSIHSWHNNFRLRSGCSFSCVFSSSSHSSIDTRNTSLPPCPPTDLSTTLCPIRPHLSCHFNTSLFSLIKAFFFPSSMDTCVISASPTAYCVRSITVLFGICSGLFADHFCLSFCKVTALSFPV